ncbi:MAG: extracellular solute-binding protein family 5, partial [Thermomicrobiales bacterium]|nr:extracellular solute-binding protein family 5 [Thermomicrobiales bacterium]
MILAKLCVRMLPIVVLAAVLLAPVAGSAQDSNPIVAQSQVSITRDEFLQQLRDYYGFEDPQQEGGTVTIAETADIRTLNALLAYDHPTRYVTNLIFEQLVSVSPIDGKPVPQLADFWEISSDNLVYTFHLNQDARWHDGTDVTAEDVEFSFDAALSGKLDRAPYSGVTAVLDDYRVVDADTFQMTASKPFVTFLYDAPGAVPIMPKHLWEGVPYENWGMERGSDGTDPSRVVGTGPFTFQEREQNVSVTLARNEAYYTSPPVIDGFVMKVMAATDRPDQLTSGDVDIVEGMNPENILEEINAGSLVFETFLTARMQFYAYNLERPIFADQRVRQALFIALDRQSLIVDVFGPLGGQVAIGTQPPISPAYAPERIADPFAYDPDRARALLEEAGWADTNGDGTIDKDGDEFSFQILANVEAPQINELLAEMRRQWQEIGVDASWQIISFEDVLPRTRAGDFDVYIQFLRGGPSGSQGALFHGDPPGGLNFMRYQNDEYDRLDDLQTQEFDDETRTKLLIELSAIAWNDTPIGILR